MSALNELAHDKIRKATLKIILNNNFFAGLLLYLNHKESSDIIGTMATDGTNLFYNSDFTCSLSINEVGFVLLHEVFHAAFDHCNPYRIGSRNKIVRNKFNNELVSLWNIAADFVVNNTLVEYLTAFNLYGTGTDQFICPKSGLIDDAYSDMSVEEIYDTLLSEIQKDETSSNLGTSGDGDCSESINLNGTCLDEHMNQSKDTFDKTENDAEENKIKWSKRFKVAIENEMYKNPSGAISSIYSKILKMLPVEKINWRSILESYINRSLVSDFTYTKPQKSMLNYGIYYPSTQSDHVDFEIYLDVSGSMHSYLDSLYSEINNAFSKFNSYTCKLVEWDTSIINETNFSYNEDLTSSSVFKGMVQGGGTAIGPVVEYINSSQSNNSKVCIIITDGDTYDSIPYKNDFNFSTFFITHQSNYNTSKFKDNDVIVIDD